MILLSPHFTLAEGLFSQVAARAYMPNNPPEPVLETMRHTAKCMEIVRDILQAPINISSWYRNPQLNLLLGSKSTSQHVKGEAVDFIAPKYGSPVEICQCIQRHKSIIPFDQLILEHTWVHISFVNPHSKARGQVLSLLKDGSFANGLVEW